MDLVGSVEGALVPLFETAYGSFEESGGMGSSVIDAVLLAPLIIVDSVLWLAGVAGRDLGSTAPL